MNGSFYRFLSSLFLFVLLMTGCATSGGEETPSFVPDGYTLRYQQDFSEPDSIDGFVFSSPGDWKRIKEGDRYALEQSKAGDAYNPPHKSPKNIGLIDRLTFNSFVLTFDVHQHGRKYNHRDACVFFNFVDPTNYYYTHLGANRDPHAFQIFTVDDSPREAITNDPLPPGGVDWDKKKWHSVRVVRNADTGRIKVFINDMSSPAMVAKSSTHGYGHIGFGSFDDQAMFTNIRVYAPAVNKRRAEFFEGKDGSK